MLFFFSLFMIFFFGWRAYTYFTCGRLIAGVASCFAILLFAASIWVDFMRWQDENAGPTYVAASSVQEVSDVRGDEVVIGDYDPDKR